MSVLFILIAISILVASGFLIAFLWSVSTGQYEDDYTPSVRILFDENQLFLSSKNLSQKKSTINKKENKCK